MRYNKIRSVQREEVTDCALGSRRGMTLEEAISCISISVMLYEKKCDMNILKIAFFFVTAEKSYMVPVMFILWPILALYFCPYPSKGPCEAPKTRAADCRGNWQNINIVKWFCHFEHNRGIISNIITQLCL